MFEPIKVAFGQYMAGFYASMVPTTQPMQEYLARGFDKSCAWAPSTMVDEVEKMLSIWQRNDTDSSTTHPPKLPVIIFAMSRDYTPTSREYTAQIGNSLEMNIPGDAKSRLFGLRVIAGDIRTQLAFMAADEPTAKSMASQFALYIDSISNRRFPSQWTFAGVTDTWPVQIETPEAPAQEIKTESQNTCLLAMDLILKATIPLFDAPAVGQPNDGKGTPGTSDPAGYPVVVQVNDYFHEPKS